MANQEGAAQVDKDLKRQAAARVAALPPVEGENGRQELLHELMLRQLALEAEVGELRRGEAEAQSRRKLAEEQMAEREAHHRAMINSFEGFIYICSADYRIEFMNERLKERTGRDATGEPCHQALHELSSVCPWCVNEKVLQGESVSWEVKSPKDGRWYHVSNTPIFHRDGSISKQALITDVTDRKLHEEGLRESTETLKTLMDMMPVGVGWNDHDGRIEYLNHRFVEQFGYTLEDIPTVEDWFRLAYPDPADREARRSFWYLAIDEGKNNGTPIPSLETQITCKDGSVRHIIRLLQLTRNRVLNAYIDITDRELMQEELLKVQKLESLGVLAGGIAHDFNNILTGVLGNISFARFVLDDPEKAGEMLKNAEQASHRAVELSRQLLTFAKGGKPVKKVISVQRLLGESVNLMLHGASVKGVLSVPATLHAIEADEGQVSQVFNNVILNAVQAMPGGGTLAIEADNVQLTSGNRMALPAGQYIRLSFADEGCGIAKEHVKKIFDPYFSTKCGGTGLGLASTQSIIRRHGGHFGVESVLGKGTTFLIHLPSIGVSYWESQKGGQQASPGTRAGGSILIMDDDETIADLASRMLRFLGYQATSCKDGERAVQLYRAAKEAERGFQAVLMDLTIPGGMGGKEAAERILEFDAGARLVVSTGYSNDPVVANYRAHGFCAVLPKPYRFDELEQVLSEL